MAQATDQHILTRRALLRGSVTAAAAASATALPIIASAAVPEPDPVLAAWRAWRPLEEEAARLSVERERIWASLPKEAREPIVPVDVPREHTLHVNSIDLYDRYTRFLDALWENHDPNLDPQPTGFQLPGDWMRGYRRNFLRRFRRAQAKARELQDRAGYIALGERLVAIWTEQEPLRIAIRESTSVSPVAIAAKIDVALSWRKGSEFLSDQPNCLTCSIVRTLFPQLPADMAAALEPIAAEQGTIREAYLRAGRS